MRKILLIILCASASNHAYSFDYILNLRKSSFEGFGVNYKLDQIIDGRLNRSKPSGTLSTGLSLDKKTVGNDSLGYHMTKFFKENPAVFNGSFPVTIVINQINIRLIKGKNNRGGKKEELEITLSLDYYTKNDTISGLLFQQFNVFREDVTFIGPKKAFNITLSNAFKSSLMEFQGQMKNQPSAFIRQKRDVDSLAKSIDTVVPQVMNANNMKDGLYFSCKDFYLNKPAAVGTYYIADTSALGVKRVALESKNYMTEDAYAIVRNGEIYIFIENSFYRRALFDDEGNVFFPGVTSAIITQKAKIKSVAAAFTIGLLGTAVGIPVQQSIIQKGTIKIKSDAIIDLQTGNLIFVNSETIKK